jgi:hypothetical protein
MKPLPTPPNNPFMPTPLRGAACAEAAIGA